MYVLRVSLSRLDRLFKSSSVNVKGWYSPSSVTGRLTLHSTYVLYKNTGGGRPLTPTDSIRGRDVDKEVDNVSEFLVVTERLD